jgi:glycosyltransferase involved in cell wall biosynthesis
MLTRAAAVQVPAAIYHASDLYVLPALRMAAERHHGRLVYDARELYPYVAATIGRPWVRVFWRTIERWGIKQADLVLTVSEGIAEKLTDAYDIARPTVLYNVPDDSAPSLRRSLRVATGLPSGEAVILHQGQMRPDRGCELLVDAMRDVEGAILVFLGDGPLKTRLQEQAAASQIAGLVRFADPVPPDELLAYTASADVGVTLLEDTCLNHQLALPNKLFEYLAAGVPVIASDLPEIRGVVRFYDVGLLVHPGHRADLVAALTQAVLDKTLRERWRRNIPRALETFSWAKASEQFLQAYRNLLAQPP